MNNLNVSVNKKTRYVNLSKTVIGVDGENLQEKIVFSFEDEFVDGTARLEFETDKKQYVLLEKENETYTIPVKNVIAKKGNIKMQLVITQGIDEENIPVFKSNQFYLWCEESINAVTEAPDSYELWIETANTKLNEVDNLDIEIVTEDGVTKVIITKKDGTKEETIVATGGALDYEFLDNLPSINEIILKGNLTTEKLGILKDVKKYIDENKEELRGPQGEPGTNGIDGTDGQDGYTPIKGKDYFDGTDGVDGFSPTANVESTENGATITIVDKIGTTTATIKNGVDGEDGKNGVDGKTPVKGEDYFTESDVDEIVDEVLAKLPSSEEVSY